MPSILVDDLGHGDLGCYAQMLIQTPNLDRMACAMMQFGGVTVAKREVSCGQEAFRTEANNHAD